MIRTRPDDDGELWLFLGDSITHGVRHTDGRRCYVELLGEHLRLEDRRRLMVNAGVAGWRIADVMESATPLAARFTPDVVTVMLGTNDAAADSGTSPQRFERSLRELVSDLRADRPDRVVVLQTPPTVLPGADKQRHERLPRYAEAVRSCARALDLPLVDHHAHWQRAADAAWFADPFHPNARGHRRLAELLTRELGRQGLDHRRDLSRGTATASLSS